jgi:hypothetical protein
MENLQVKEMKQIFQDLSEGKSSTITYFVIGTSMM